MADEYSFTIEADGETDTVTVPAAAVDLLTEQGETPPNVAGDLVMLGLAQQLHGVIHHAQGEVDPDIEAAEDALMDAFEERFGQTFGEMTGHDH